MGVASDQSRQVSVRRGLVVGGAGLAVLAAAQFSPGRRGQNADADMEGRWGEDLRWARAVGIIEPAAEGPFRAAEPVTREELAVLLYRLAGAPDYPALASSPYRDVTDKARHVCEILWLRGQGIALGAFDATFRPTERVSRGEVCAMLCRMLRAQLAHHRGTDPFETATASVPGVPETHRYAREIGWAADAGLIAAVSDGDRFPPDAELSRGQCVHVLRCAEELFA